MENNTAGGSSLFTTSSWLPSVQAKDQIETMGAENDGDDLSRMSARERALFERFVENYPKVQYSFVGFLSEHLADVSRTFQGDLQLPLVLAVLGQRRLQWFEETRNNGGQPPNWSPAMPAMRIADVTGIPRETVRRKLAELERAGWIERADAGWTLVVRDGEAPARAGLAELDRRSLLRAARFLIALQALL